MGDPSEIRLILAEEIIDGVALGRPLITDPDLPLKMKENRDEDVIQCGACLQGCLMKAKTGEGLSCIVNPEAGRESEQIQVADHPGKVVVVGGGPAGMQAALTARQRGYKVSLYDEGELGGQFQLAAMAPGKEMMNKPLQGMIRKVRKSDITLRLDNSATIQDILNEKPDHVILATGATSIKLEIEGLNEALDCEDVFMEKRDIGQRVIIIGGGMIGLEMAEFLAKKGHSITIVEMLEEVASDMEPITRKLTMKNLASMNVSIITGKKVKRFDGHKTFITESGQEVLLGEFDTVVMAVGTIPTNNLEQPILDSSIDFHLIGDAKKPANIADAVVQGFETACKI